MEFTLIDNDEGNKALEFVEANTRLAEITWWERNGVMLMNHTYVSDALRGRGIAKQLLDAAAEYARANELKMKAICSYVVAAFDKSNAYDDIKA